MTGSDIDPAFAKWWEDEGSAAPFGIKDHEEHTHDQCRIAWANGRFKEAEKIEGLKAYLDERKPGWRLEFKVWDAMRRAKR